MWVDVGGVELLATLGDALDRLEYDEVVRSWLPANLWRTFIAAKRKEFSLMAELTSDHDCERNWQCLLTSPRRLSTTIAMG